MKARKNKAYIYVEVDKEFKKAILAYAKLRYLSVSALVRIAVMDTIKNDKISI
jgi:hypothetical protein